MTYAARIGWAREKVVQKQVRSRKNENVFFKKSLRLAVKAGRYAYRFVSKDVSVKTTSEVASVRSSKRIRNVENGKKQSPKQSNHRLK